MVEPNKNDLKTGSKKILIMGLDNSGKTSIVLCLKGVKNLMSFRSLYPTKGVNVIDFKATTSYNIWDFGGQESYRKDYLEDFERYIQGTNKLIFVIDVQDVKRYDIALDYLEKIINLLPEDRKNIDFSIFLHKFDPDFVPDFDPVLINKLIKDIKSLIPHDLSCSIFKSSIYTVFEKSSID